MRIHKKYTLEIFSLNHSMKKTGCHFFLSFQQCWQFGQFSDNDNDMTILKFFDNFDNFDKFDSFNFFFFKFLQLCLPFWQVKRQSCRLVTFETLITILTNCHGNTWQLRVTLDSIHNSCDVYVGFNAQKCIWSCCSELPESKDGNASGVHEGLNARAMYMKA